MTEPVRSPCNPGSPFNRRQAWENQAFLSALRRTGNAREAARSVGMSRSTFLKRRARDKVFATAWEQALVVAQADLHARGGAPDPGSATPGIDANEPRIVKMRSGRLQLRRVRPRQITRAVEQAFLSALSATANVRLSAAAAGFHSASFYARRRQSPAFAREMRLALETGYEQLEMALLAAAEPQSYLDDAWRHNDPPLIPSMSAEVALQMLYLHNKSVHQLAEPPHIKRRRGESIEAHSYRLGEMYQARMERQREEFNIAEAARRAGGAPHLFGPKILPLPALDQVTGWSKAKARKG